MRTSALFMIVGMLLNLSFPVLSQANEIEFSISDQVGFACSTIEFTPDGCVPIDEKRLFSYTISYEPEYMLLTWRGEKMSFSHLCEYGAATPPTPFRIIDDSGFAYSARKDCAYINKPDFEQFTVRNNDLGNSSYFEEITIRIWPYTQECDAMSRLGSLPPTKEQPLPVRQFYIFGSCSWK